MPKSNEKMRGFHIRILIFASVLCFPLFSNLVEHAGSSILILLAVLGILVCLSKKRRPGLTRQEKGLICSFTAYFMVYMISFTVNALNGNLEQLHTKYLEKEFYLLFFIPVYFLFKRIKLPQWVIWYGLSAGAIGAGIYSIIDSGWFEAGQRVRGAYNPILFGDLSLLMAFLNFQSVYYFRQKHAVLVMIPVLGFILGTMAGFLTGSRGGWVAIPGFVVILILQLKHYFKLWVTGAAIGGILLASLVAYEAPFTGVATRIQGAFEDFHAFSKGNVTWGGGVGNRLESWRAAWLIFKNHPFLGIGPGGYGYAIRDMISRRILRHDIEVYFNQPHDIYLSVMVDSGLVGLAALLSIFLLPLNIAGSWIRKKEKNPEAAYAIFVLVSGFMIFGLTETVFGRSVFVSFYLIMMAAFLSQRDTVLIAEPVR